MSHLKFPPTTDSAGLTRVAMFAAFFASVALSSGCAMVQIPSYRLEECAAEEYSSTPSLVPPLPMPGWLAKWKAEKDLPKPPESPRFHPLPTRPMFQPQRAPKQFAGGAIDGTCYGQLPPSEAWNQVETLPAQQTPTLAAPQ